MKMSEETTEKLDEILERFNNESSTVLRQEAKDNNPYKVGDIVEDHYQTGKIITVVISVYVPNRSTQTTFKCERLTKKLKPYKGGEETTIHLGNVKRLILN